MRFQRQSLQPGLAVFWGQAKAPVPSHPPRIENLDPGLFAWLTGRVHFLSGLTFGVR